MCVCMVHGVTSLTTAVATAATAASGHRTWLTRQLSACSSVMNAGVTSLHAQSWAKLKIKSLVELILTVQMKLIMLKEGGFGIRTGKILSIFIVIMMYFDHYISTRWFIFGCVCVYHACVTIRETFRNIYNWSDRQYPTLPFFGWQI